MSAMKEGPSRKLGYRPADVQVLFGSVQIYRDVVEAGWLKPIIQRKRLTVFDHADVLRVWERIRRGEYPRTSSGTRNGG